MNRDKEERKGENNWRKLVVILGENEISELAFRTKENEDFV